MAQLNGASILILRICQHRISQLWF